MTTASLFLRRTVEASLPLAAVLLLPWLAPLPPVALMLALNPAPAETFVLLLAALEAEAEDAAAANTGLTETPLVGSAERGEQLDAGGGACGVGVTGSPL
jgi:hypothetical protein